MRWYLLVFYFCTLNLKLSAQNLFDTRFNLLKRLELDYGVNLTFDEPPQFNLSKPTKVIVYALPNGNSTAQTFGKSLLKDDDWHFDIQHIGAQTEFIRHTDHHVNYIVVYLENILKSWPAWRKNYSNSDVQIARIIEIIVERYQNYHPTVILSAHSGGGSFIFGYLNTKAHIPTYIERIGFLDADYGYETERHRKKLKAWLKLKHKSLQVIAYNDSVVTYNGKPLVSPTGGTWYRSKLMAKDLESDFGLKQQELLDRLNWNDKKHQISFTLIKNPMAKIYHTVLVERNGFIQLIFNGTVWQDKDYQFWGDRAYQQYVLK